MTLISRVRIWMLEHLWDVTVTHKPWKRASLPSIGRCHCRRWTNNLSPNGSLKKRKWNPPFHGRLSLSSQRTNEHTNKAHSRPNNHHMKTIYLFALNKDTDFSRRASSKGIPLLMTTESILVILVKICVTQEILNVRTFSFSYTIGGKHLTGRDDPGNV